MSNLEAKPYRKLPGTFRGFFRRHSVWLGEDHILLVDSARFSETYKRFYLTDIQAFTIRKTTRLAIPVYWWIGAFVTTIALLTSIGRNWGWPTALFATAGAAIAIYLYIASVYQSCRCTLITRVNHVEIPSLFRLSTAREFAGELSRLVADKQGALPADWAALAANQPASQSLDLSAIPDVLNPSAPRASQRGLSWLPLLAFALLLVDAAITSSVWNARDSAVLTIPNWINVIALTGVSITALVRIFRSQGSRVLTALLLAGLLVVAASNYSAQVALAIDRQLNKKPRKRVTDYPGLESIARFEIGADVLIAGLGLGALLLQRRPRKGPETLGLGLR